MSPTLWQSFCLEFVTLKLMILQWLYLILLNKVYSPGQAILQFSHCDCDSQILCEIKFGHCKSYKTAILVILKVLKFDFWWKVHIWKRLKFPNFLFMTLRFYIHKIKFSNFMRSKSLVTFKAPKFWFLRKIHSWKYQTLQRFLYFYKVKIVN